MIVIEDSTVLLIEPAQVWKVLIDVPKWWPFYYGAAAKYKDYGWSEKLQHLGGEHAGARYGALRNGVVMQTMRFEVFEPPTVLTVASEPWNPERASVSQMNKKMAEGRWKNAHRTVNAVQWKVFFTLTRESVTHTKLTVRGEFQYLQPVVGLLFHLGTKLVIRYGTDKLLKNLPHLLQ